MVKFFTSLLAPFRNDSWKSVGTLAVGIVAIWGGYVWLTHIIDSRIDERFANSENLKKVAALVRPYVIFNQDGAVLHDGGAMDLFDGIEVIKAPAEFAEQQVTSVVSITVHPKHFLATPPILQLLKYSSTYLDPKRGPGFDLIYDVDDEPLIKERPELIFRLELLN